jgi:hypothetical protein
VTRWQERSGKSDIMLKRVQHDRLLPFFVVSLNLFQGLSSHHAAAKYNVHKQVQPRCFLR